MDASLIIYTGVALTNTGILPNTDLQTILAQIDTAIANNTTAPDFTPWNLYCVTQIDGVSQPTNIENFSKGISKILCDHIADYVTFTGTTYVNDQTVITGAINALQIPGLTYAPFGIVNTDTANQLWTKSFVGFDAIIASIDPSTANWAAIGVGTPPTTVPGAFDEIILVAQAALTTLAGKEDAVGTWDNTANCLAGGATDDLRTTLDLLIAYSCLLPAYDSNNISWSCVAQGGDLELDIQSIVDKVRVISTNYLSEVGQGLDKTTLGGCAGFRADADPDWVGYHKVAVDLADSQNLTYGFLEDKLDSDDGSVTIVNQGDYLSLEVTSPAGGKAKVNASDPTADFLQAKIVTTGSNWGIALNIAPSSGNDTLEINPVVNNGELLVTNILTAIAGDPDLLAQFCALVSSCTGCVCGIPEDLEVTFNGMDFELSWTPSGTANSQTVRFRLKNLANWTTASGITPANPLSGSANAATVAGSSNEVYQFEVLSNCCPGVVGESGVIENVIFENDTLSVTQPGGGVIHVAPTLPHSTLDVIDYRLTDQNLQVLQSTTRPWTSSAHSFTAVPASNYYVQFRYGATINGVPLYSDDVAQAGVWYQTPVIIVP